MNKFLSLTLFLVSFSVFATQPHQPSSPQTIVNSNPYLKNTNSIGINTQLTNKLSNSVDVTNKLSNNQSQSQKQSQEAVGIGIGFSKSTSNSKAVSGDSISGSYSGDSISSGGSSSVNISSTSVTNVPKNTPSLATLFGYAAAAGVSCSNSVGGSGVAEGKGFSVLFPWQDEVCYFLLMADRLSVDADRLNNFKTKEVICEAMVAENDPIAEAREKVDYSCHQEMLDNQAAFNQLKKEANDAAERAAALLKSKADAAVYDAMKADRDRLFKQLITK